MPAKRLLMRQIRDVLRLKHVSLLSNREIGRVLGVSYSMVAKYLDRAADLGLSWPLPEDLDDPALERRLFRHAVGYSQRPLPDWAKVHAELKRSGVTLRLLWEEYRERHPDGYGQSRFFALYRLWRGRTAPSMRQRHVAGEKLFVDYAGQTVEIVDMTTGEVRDAQIFVAALGASNYTFAEASWSQQLPDWLGSHARAFEFFGGVPKLVVPDNLKSAVGKATWFEPQLNRSDAELARHYNTAILPARPRKPKDKSKVEVAVQLVERWVLAKLRNRRFHSLAALNLAIRELVDELNRRHSRHLGKSRQELFEEIDRPALQPLPTERYEFAEWKECRVALDYHIEIDKHYYSVPHQLMRQEVSARITARTVEIFHHGKRVACHLRSRQQRRHTTIAEHMPSAHRRYAGWTHEKLCSDGHRIGADTGTLIERILERKPHPEQGFRACIGIIRLAKTHGESRLESACGRALAIGGLSYTSVASILKNHLDRQPPEPELPLLQHANIRGPGYFH